MRNIALKLNVQRNRLPRLAGSENAVSVCGTLEKALTEITGERVHLTGCGRTDAGVHAEAYVANFRTASRIPLERLPFAINTHTRRISPWGGDGGSGGFQRHRLLPEEGVYLPHL